MLELPPLNSLRAFEATARHLSFSLAADELCVTPGAVSRHVAKLEDYLRVPLFVRNHRQVQLTSSGVSYFRHVHGALCNLSETTGLHRLRATSEGSSVETDTLRLKSSPVFARQWLVPRLGRFKAQHPTIGIQIVASHKPADFDQEDIDVAIQSGASVEGQESERLFGEVLAPICRPALVRRLGPHRTPGDLSRATLLHSIERPNDWHQWLEAAGHSDLVLSSSRILTFNSSLVYQAMYASLGFAIAKVALVAEHLAGGGLVAPFDLRIRNSNTYHVVFSDGGAATQKVAEFRKWISEEARITRQIAQE